MIAYQRRNLGKNINYTLERPLPSEGKILVKAGQEVVPETVIAVGKKQAGFRQVNLAKVLEVDSAEVVLVKTVGSRVYRGDLIAKAPKLWGIKEAQYRSPLEGILTEYEAASGRAGFQYLPESQNIAAGMWGEVKKVLPKEKIVIGSLADRVNLLVNLGNPREGSLASIGHRDLPLEPKHLEKTHAQRIVVGGTLATEDFYYRALNMRVRGVVTGGMDYAIYNKLRSSRGRFEDIGLTIGVTEGFGQLAIEEKLSKYLQGKEGQFVFLDGRAGELILPVAERSGARGEGQGAEGEARGFTTLKSGQRARILVGSHAGRCGIVGAARDEEVEIKIGEESIAVLPENIEVLIAQKFEIPSTKSETNLNDRNLKVQNI